ncbi:MAG: hypothetical protein QUS66_10245, partial [Bacteroidota bacterium]|nr:hypothetical protein [Bacteroidota bacterium]
MKRSYIVLLAVFFFLAISALVIIQVRWINSVVSAEDQEFRFAVNEALKEVVSELERAETYKRIMSGINPGPLPEEEQEVSDMSAQRSAEEKLLEKYGFDPDARSVIISRAGYTYLLDSDSLGVESFFENAEPGEQTLSAGANTRMTSKIISIENIVSRILHETPPLRDRFTADEINTL